jgi:hypothetical protein
MFNLRMAIHFTVVAKQFKRDATSLKNAYIVLYNLEVEQPALLVVSKAIITLEGMQEGFQIAARRNLNGSKTAAKVLTALIKLLT